MREPEFANAWAATALDAAAPKEAGALAGSEWAEEVKTSLRQQPCQADVALTSPSPLPVHLVENRQDGEMVGPWVVAFRKFTGGIEEYLACDAFGRVLLHADLTTIGFFLAGGDTLLAEMLALAAKAAQEGLRLTVTYDLNNRSFVIAEDNGFAYSVPRALCNGETPGLVPGRPASHPTDAATSDEWEP